MADTTMSFPEYRELLVHIHQSHSPRLEKPDGRVVREITCTTFMDTGRVSYIRMIGDDWEKTFRATDRDTILLERCHLFLDKNPAAEGEDNLQEQKRVTKALDAVTRILLESFGRQCAEYGDDFGAHDLKFTIPSSVLIEAIKESDRERTHETG